jgi:hypothetical protein
MRISVVVDSFRICTFYHRTASRVRLRLPRSTGRQDASSGPPHAYGHRDEDDAAQQKDKRHQQMPLRELSRNAFD